MRTLAARGLTERVSVGREVCFGHCRRGPNLLVCPRAEPPGPGFSRPAPTIPGAMLYHGLAAAQIDQVIDRHFEGGRVLGALREAPSGA
jgi:(2Fe-2S) ferredoxin